MQRMVPESPVYCEAIACRILSELDVPALQQACQWLADRHASLRTTYGIHKGKPAQFVHEKQKVPLHVHDASDWGEQELHSEFERQLRRTLNLEAGPMVRGSLFLRRPGEHLLLLTFHHIAIDLYSMVLVFQDFLRLYPIARLGRSCPPPLATHYSDFVRWQNSFVESAEGNRQLDFWRERSALNTAPLLLPCDFKHSDALSLECDTCRFTLSADLVTRLRSLAPGSGATLNAVLLGAFQSLLHLWCGQASFNIRTIVLGRSDPAFSNVVGFFSALVPIQADFTDDPAFVEVVLRARDSVIAAFENQDYPMLLLPGQLQPAGYANLSCDVLFRMQIPQRFRSELREQKLVNEFGISATTRGVRMSSGDLVTEVLVPEKKASINSIDLELVEAGGEIAGFLHYRTQLFNRDTIERLGDGYARLLANAAEDPDMRVSKMRGIGIIRKAADAGGRKIGRWKYAFEPDELAAVLCTHPGVRGCRVVFCQEKGAATHVVAYIVPRLPSPTDDELRSYLKDRIYNYAIPSVFVFSDTLPVSAISESAGELQSVIASESSAPRTPTERWLAGQWSHLFDLDYPCRNDNFSFLGGDSLMAVYLSAMISQEFNIETPMGLLLKSPTLAELAAYIDEHR